MPAAIEDEFVLYIILLLFRFFEARFGVLRYGAGGVMDALDSGASCGVDGPLRGEDCNI